MADERHDPTFYATGRFGYWAGCTCGWRSIIWSSGVGAQLEFGEHLTEVSDG